MGSDAGYLQKVLLDGHSVNYVNDISAKFCAAINEKLPAGIC